MKCPKSGSFTNYWFQFVDGMLLGQARLTVFRALSKYFSGNGVSDLPHSHRKIGLHAYVSKLTSFLLDMSWVILETSLSR